MDAYQNLISGDKWSTVTQGNCSWWLLPYYKYYTQKQHQNQVSMLSFQPPKNIVYSGWVNRMFLYIPKQIARCDNISFGFFQFRRYNRANFQNKI